MVAQLQEEHRAEVEIRGAVSLLWKETPTGEWCFSGPAGTGKTRAILEYIHWRCTQERLRVLMLRKTEESLRTSALVTYQDEVLWDFDGKRSVADGVRFFGGNKILPAQFIYEETSSIIVVGGMDNPNKVKSSQWDIVFINEVTELKQNDYEMVTSRTDRPGLAIRPPSLVISDCNPDAPTHWIRLRAREGLLRMFRSFHKDNPSMWDERRKEWTASGRRYLARLNKLTGIRRARLLLGLWVAAEGLVYNAWNPQVHVIKWFKIPEEWTRYLAIDFGFVNPFVAQWWAEDPEGRLFCYREIYVTQKLVEDAAADILRLSEGEPRFAAVITDHDAEDRATFEKKTGYRTTSAKKNVSAGINAVAERLTPDDDGRPRIFFLSGYRVEEDQDLRDSGRPTSTIEEFPSYVWDIKASSRNRKGDVPVKLDDHGMDTTRYMVAHRDLGTPNSKAVPVGIAAPSHWVRPHEAFR